MTNYLLIASPIQDNGRIKWVDTAKAIGLVLVFWGHLLYEGSDVAEVINKAIYSYHMPMYFILCGYVLKPDRQSFGEYVRCKFYRVLLPALILYFVTLPLFFYFLDYRTETVVSIFRTICYIDGQCAYNLPIWFFFCLFEIYLFTKLFDLPGARMAKLVSIMLFSLLLSYLGYEWKLDCLNFLGFNKFLLGLFFVSFGLLLKQLHFDRIMMIIGLVSIPLWLITGIWLNTKVSMYGVIYGDFWLFIISALSGSFCFFAFCKMFEKIEMIRSYSKWTIFIVCSHYVLVTFFSYCSSKLGIIDTYYFDILSFLFVVTSLIIYAPFCVYFDKHIPVLTGNKLLCKK